jgi:hypothetical protein
MQCPFCAFAITPGAVVCEKCGATRITRRSTTGVFAGWAGMVIALIWTMLWIPLLFLPFIGYDISDYPWITLIVGSIVAAGLLWYSKSTIHSEWIRRED